MEDKEKNYFSNGAEFDNFTTSMQGSDLLDFYSDPSHFKLKNSSGANDAEDMPGNVFLILSHGSYALPDGVENRLIGYNDGLQSRKSAVRLLKNFSDFGTGYISEHLSVAKENIIKSGYSRAIGDCNRDVEASKLGSEYVKPIDFNGIKLFDSIEGFHDLGLVHYQLFHTDIENKLQAYESQGKSTLCLDLHDTGAILLGQKRDDDVVRPGGFPAMHLANIDYSSCDPEVFDFFSARLEYYMGLKIYINDYYPGGYITKRHGSEERLAGNTLRNVIHVEIGRFLYMNEREQEVDTEQLKVLSNCLNNALKDTAIWLDTK